MAKSTSKQSSKVERGPAYDAYMYVVRNWAVGTDEVATGLGVERPEANRLLRSLERTGLIEGVHVNQERAITWQSHYDIENNDPAEVERNATADFDAAGITIVDRRRGHEGTPRNDTAAHQAGSYRVIFVKLSDASLLPRGERTRFSTKRAAEAEARKRNKAEERTAETSAAMWVAEPVSRRRSY